MATKAKYTDFLQTLQTHYRLHWRHDLPWRQPEADGSFDTYKILLSEVMLQQTQVPRVITKYREFLTAFPTIETLAAAELGQVLRLWSGLGYNRRAKYLHETAKAITALGYFPNSVTELVKLPGVGRNTAGAIVAYAFNQPVLFVETNVRTVYIHHFFADQSNIPDSRLIELVEQTLDGQNPREFYWSVMDYGSHLKKEIGNVNKLSKHYSKQSQFHNSKRQIRGQVLKLLSKKQFSLAELATTIPDTRLNGILQELTSEGLVRRAGKLYRL